MLLPTNLETAASASSSGPTAPCRLSGELHALAARAPASAFTIGDLMELLGARATGLLILLCALPFCSPITIPGLSTPFGFIILLLAGRFTLGLPPWLPQRLRRVEIPSPTLIRILEASGRVLRWIENRLRPRWKWMVDASWKLRLHSIVVAMSAVVLMLPLPPVPPLTNTLPALVVVFLTMSMLENDGAGIAVGYGIFGGMILYFIFWAGLIVETLMKIWGS